jgi:hypothetical protein
MELVQAHQVPFDELLKESIDVIIAACGIESRSSHLVQLSQFNASKKIALLFKEGQEEKSWQENEVVFRENGFECYELHCDAAGEIISVLEKICIKDNCEKIKLVIDYSSMTKLWYGTIINYFAFNDLEYNNLTVYFCYTPEHFVPPAARKLKLSNPVPIFFNRPVLNENKPLALLIGLGYEDSRVEFLCDFFKPDDVYFFLPNPSFDDKYTQMAKAGNSNVLSKVKSSHLLNYAAKDLEDIDSKLTSLCLNLRLKYRINLVSLGPKTFSLASFLLNARYPDIEIWNLTSDEKCLDLKPSGTPIVYKAVLSSDEDL